MALGCSLGAISLHRGMYMKNLLLLLSLIFLTNCSDITGPSGMNVTFPVTYIEWEAMHPQDTTWWTFSADGTVYAAWKRKVTEIARVPTYDAWKPHCLGYDCNGDCVPRTNSYGEAIGYGPGIVGPCTHSEWLRNWEKMKSGETGWLPIQYYKGSWSDLDGWRLTLAVNRVIPGNYGGRPCNMKSVTYVESLWDPQYLNYDFWTTDSLYGFQCDEDGERIPLQHSEPNVKWSQWHGKSLTDKSNPIFRQL